MQILLTKIRHQREIRLAYAEAGRAKPLSTRSNYPTRRPTILCRFPRLCASEKFSRCFLASAACPWIANSHQRFRAVMRLECVNRRQAICVASYKTVRLNRLFNVWISVNRAAKQRAGLHSACKQPKNVLFGRLKYFNIRVSELIFKITSCKFTYSVRPP